MNSFACNDIPHFAFNFLSDHAVWSKPVTTGTAPGIRAGHTMTAVKTKLLVFGGGDGNQYLNDLHILDTETMAWSQAYVAGTSPAARSRHSTCLIGGSKLLVFGGGDDSRVYNDLYVLDIETMSWSRPTMRGMLPVSHIEMNDKDLHLLERKKKIGKKSARWGHTMNAMQDGRLLLFGGHDGTKMLQGNFFTKNQTKKNRSLISFLKQ